MHLDRARPRPASGPARWLILVIFSLGLNAGLSGCSGVDAPIVAGDADEDVTQHDASDDTSAEPIDTGSDAEDTEPDPCPVCCAGAARCGVGGAREVCNETGTAYTPTPCDEGTSCRAGVCEPDPICTPGETRCLDAQTQITCRATGLAYRTDACTGDQVCAAGQCRSGLPNGTDCSSDNDCAGGRCLSLGATSYCTQLCESDACSDSEVCWNVDGIAHQSVDHCLQGCQVSCARQDMRCAAVRTLVDGQIAWSSGCIPSALKQIGARCNSDAECASEICRLDYFSDSSDNPIGYCTRSCEAGGCPQGSACVNLGSGQWCQPRCSEGVCPLDPSGNNLRIRCGGRSEVGSVNPANVCIRP